MVISPFITDDITRIRTRAGMPKLFLQEPKKSFSKSKEAELLARLQSIIRYAQFLEVMKIFFMLYIRE